MRAQKNFYLAIYILGLISIGMGVHYIPDINPNNIFVIYAIIAILALFGIFFRFLENKFLRKPVLIIVAMFAFGFVMVPIYDVFCDITGINGKMDLSITAATPDGVIEDRIVTVEFVVNQNESMPWTFTPKHTTMKIRPGEIGRTAYYATNNSKKTMTAQAIPSIAPSIASKHFRKVQCFCFSSQKLGPKQHAAFDLHYYLDPKLPKEVKRVTLSYTLFDISGDKQDHTGGHA